MVMHRQSCVKDVYLSWICCPYLWEFRCLVFLNVDWCDVWNDMLCFYMKSCICGYSCRTGVLQSLKVEMGDHNFLRQKSYSLAATCSSGVEAYVDGMFNNEVLFVKKPWQIVDTAHRKYFKPFICHFRSNSNMKDFICLFKGKILCFTYSSQSLGIFRFHVYVLI